jgi:hypothetical protein
LLAAEHRYAKLYVSTNATKSCCKFLFGEQHIYNDKAIGYIIYHPITIALKASRPLEWVSMIDDNS